MSDFDTIVKTDIQYYFENLANVVKASGDIDHIRMFDNFQSTVHSLISHIPEIRIDNPAMEDVAFREKLNDFKAVYREAKGVYMSNTQLKTFINHLFTRLVPSWEIEDDPIEVALIALDIAIINRWTNLKPEMRSHILPYFSGSSGNSIPFAESPLSKALPFYILCSRKDYENRNLHIHAYYESFTAWANEQNPKTDWRAAIISYMDNAAFAIGFEKQQKKFAGAEQTNHFATVGKMVAHYLNFKPLPDIKIVFDEFKSNTLHIVIPKEFANEADAYMTENYSESFKQLKRVSETNFKIQYTAK